MTKTYQIEEACLFPESGFPVVNRFLSNVNIRRKLIGNYTMYYLPDFVNEQILVLRVVYSKRNIEGVRVIGLEDIPELSDFNNYTK